jgi:hypothetical protein
MLVVGKGADFRMVWRIIPAGNLLFVLEYMKGITAVSRPYALPAIHLPTVAQRYSDFNPEVVILFLYLNSYKYNSGDYLRFLEQDYIVD